MGEERAIAIQQVERHSYEVLARIEHDGILYIPKQEDAPLRLPTAGAAGGGEVPVDASGVIHLTARQAAHMTTGQLRLHQGHPDPISGPRYRAERAEFEAQQAEEQRQKDAQEMELFRAFKVSRAGGKSADSTDTEESEDEPTIKCVVLKDFKFNGEKYKQSDERELTYNTIQKLGKEKVKVLDVPAYVAAKAAQKK